MPVLPSLFKHCLSAAGMVLLAAALGGCAHPPTAPVASDPPSEPAASTQPSESIETAETNKSSASSAPTLRRLDNPIDCVLPNYPATASQMSIEANVVVRFNVNAEGRVVDARIEQPFALRDAANGNQALAPTHPLAASLRTEFIREALTFTRSCRFEPAPDAALVEARRQVRFSMGF